MEGTVVAALIEAGANVLAAVIGVLGVFAILRHRKKVQALADELVAYYEHEGQLVREICRLRGIDVATEGKRLAAYRGQFRAELSESSKRPRINANQARRMGKRLF